MAGDRLQMQRPFAERRRLSGQRLAVVGGMQVLEQHAPRHAVHRQVMDRHEQAGERFAGHAEEPGRQQRAMRDVDAALRVSGGGAHRRQALAGVAGNHLLLEERRHLAAGDDMLGPAARIVRETQSQRVVMFVDLPERVGEPRRVEIRRHRIRTV